MTGIGPASAAQPEPTTFGHFWQVRTANGVDLDFDTYGEGLARKP